MTSLFDPIRAVRGLRALLPYAKGWLIYSNLPEAEPLLLQNALPQLHEKTGSAPVDIHYFYVNGWAMRRIVTQRPAQHVDIGSQTMLVNLLSALLPVTFVDYRPLQERMEGLTSSGGNILHLPFADQSINSLSCLHVLEHIGLGRYGDPLNPQGTRQACSELERVLAPGGNLYVALPVGKPRVCFNAHRIHAPQTIIDYFAGLDLIAFCGIDDSGRYTERNHVTDFADSLYACGMYWFRRKR